MIPSNLKVGDTFTDGGNTYVVKEVVEVGYISKMVEDIPFTEDVKEEVETPTVKKRGRRSGKAE